MTVFDLPALMVAPNGARRTRVDHPALPVTIPEIVQCASDCFAAGADGIHAHVRDGQGQHVLDAGLYRELLAELTQQVPGLRVQVTSEAAGRYQAPEQQAVIRELVPAYVSVALREMLPPGFNTAQEQQARDFYHWAAEQGVMIQHILYTADDLQQWLQWRDDGLIPAGTVTHLLFVLGRYAARQQSQPEDMEPFLACLKPLADNSLQWAVCAFGPQETDCLVAAHRQGGHIRVGFENSLWHADGRVAASNRERVEAVRRALSP
ncbi:MAG TPA: 3-keto-5-aminohexanoate cleavage protein [Thiolinea sp.]|nr:3-keto-5-aminohexanoate cleavage protein [Thiolinea sp.]